MNSISYLSVSSQFIQQQSKNFMTGPRVCPRTISGHGCTVVWVDELVSDFDAFELIGTKVSVSWKRRFVDAIPLSCIYLYIYTPVWFLYLSMYYIISIYIYTHTIIIVGTILVLRRSGNVRFYRQTHTLQFQGENGDEPWWTIKFMGTLWLWYVKIAIENGHRNSEFSH